MKKCEICITDDSADNNCAPPLLSVSSISVPLSLIKSNSTTAVFTFNYSIHFSAMAKWVDFRRNKSDCLRTALENLTMIIAISTCRHMAPLSRSLYLYESTFDAPFSSTNSFSIFSIVHICALFVQRKNKFSFHSHSAHLHNRWLSKSIHFHRLWRCTKIPFPFFVNLVNVLFIRKKVQCLCFDHFSAHVNDLFH